MKDQNPAGALRERGPFEPSSTASHNFAIAIMIALMDSLPLIEFHNGRAIAFDQGWLVESLSTAAQKAGYRQWWLAEHVAESVTQFLRTQREINVLPVDRLASAVRSALEVIGYPEVAQHFEAGRPRIRVSLLELAYKAGSGYELVFFQLLRACIRDLVLEERCDFELLDLEACVKVLRSKKAWTRDCETLRGEIVDFTRSQTELAAERNRVTFALS